MDVGDGRAEWGVDGERSEVGAGSSFPFSAAAVCSAN